MGKEEDINMLKDRLAFLEYVQKLDMAEKSKLRRMIEKIAEQSEEVINRTKTGKWWLYDITEVVLAGGETAYIPMLKCPCCGKVMDNRLRLMIPTAKTMECPKFCCWCGAEMHPLTDADIKKFRMKRSIGHG